MACQFSSWHLSSHTQLSALHWGQWPPLWQGRQGHFQGLRELGSSSSSERIPVGKRSEKEAFWGHSLRLSHPAVTELQKPDSNTEPLGFFLSLRSCSCLPSQCKKWLQYPNRKILRDSLLRGRNAIMANYPCSNQRPCCMLVKGMDLYHTLRLKIGLTTY